MPHGALLELYPRYDLSLKLHICTLSRPIILSIVSLTANISRPLLQALLDNLLKSQENSISAPNALFISPSLLLR